jgi:hypothetical protein
VMKSVGAALPLSLWVDDQGGALGTRVWTRRGHEQPLPSIEPDTIDNLAQPTTCSLILLAGGSF